MDNYGNDHINIPAMVDLALGIGSASRNGGQVSYILEFRIDGLPKTTNSNNRIHWSVKHRESRKWKGAVFLAVVTRLPLKPLSKARLTLVRHSSAEPDADGCVSSFKHVIDGLVEARVLVNDKMTNIGMPTYAWIKAPPKKGFITVKVEEVA